MVPFHTQNLKQRPQFEWNNSGRPSADGHDHHHVGARSHLPYAVEVDELREGEPVVDLFGSWAGALLLLAARPIPQDGDHPDGYQNPRYRLVKPVDPNDRYDHEDEVVDMGEGLAPELHGRSQDKPYGRRGHAAKHRGNDRPITAYVVREAYAVHKQRPRQADATYRGHSCTKAA